MPAFLTRIFESGVSVASGAGAEAIMTIDTGFALLPASQLTIYTDRSRVASCRSKRPR
jgi:hypothetical protein